MSQLENICVARCMGDAVYVGQQGTLNVNGINISIRDSRLNTGFTANLDKGFRNRVTVQHHDGGKGVFRVNYVENRMECQYAEKSTPVGVEFGPNGKRNHIEFQDHNGVFGEVYKGNLANNHIKALADGKEW